MKFDFPDSPVHRETCQLRVTTRNIRSHSGEILFRGTLKNLAFNRITQLQFLMQLHELLSRGVSSRVFQTQRGVQAYETIANSQRIGTRRFADSHQNVNPAYLPHIIIRDVLSHHQIDE